MLLKINDLLFTFQYVYIKTIAAPETIALVLTFTFQYVYIKTYIRSSK